MKSYKIAVIPGDGIGVEVVKSSIEVLNTLQKGKNFKLEFNEFDWSSEYYFKHGKMMPRSLECSFLLQCFQDSLVSLIMISKDLEEHDLD